MKQMTVTDAMKLVKAKTAPAISIYLKTDYREADNSGKIRSNLARLYKKVEQLVSSTYDQRTKDRLLDPLRRAISGLHLTKAKGGLAIYHSENFTGIVRLPTPVEDLAVASESFHLKPVLRCAQVRSSYYLLVLRKKCADIFMMTPDGVRKLDRIDMNERSEFRSVTNSTDHPKRWFGNGLKLKTQKSLRESMVMLNRQLTPILEGERHPLVVAGPHSKQQMFRDHCTYQYVFGQGLMGEMEYMDEKALSSLSDQLIEHHYVELEQRTVSMFSKAEASGLASTDLTEIAAAAAMGQIKNLIIAEDQHVWGILDRSTGAVELLNQKQEATSDDLLDDIAELTILKGGQVTVLPSYQMPRGKLIAAIYRWGTAPLKNDTPLFLNNRRDFSFVSNSA